MKSCAAIYDFELMPYALGDVLTWNIRTAIRCEELGYDSVDIHICLDQRYPASIYQSDIINADNCWMFFNELIGAFGTNPRLGDIVIHRSRDAALTALRSAAERDVTNAEPLADYEYALANLKNEEVLVAYFTKNIYYHKGINAFAKQHGRIPFLQASVGCGPDVESLLAKQLADKRIVAFHMRMRRLDAGYGGTHTYARDSDFLEWYDFLSEAHERYPDVQFIAVGRLQEKPLELLALPNVTSLRTLGLGLGHELTLMLRSDLFIGTSSGFAALANFSKLPYFITRMGQESCNAYEISFGSDRLPFAAERQHLIYEPETTELLMNLLKQGLAKVPPRTGTLKPELDLAINVDTWEWERNQWLYPGATTARFRTDTPYRLKETAFLVHPKIQQATEAWRSSKNQDWAWSVFKRIQLRFPDMCADFPEFLELGRMMAAEKNDEVMLQACQDNLQRLGPHAEKPALEQVTNQYRARSFALKTYIRFVWHNRRLIVLKLKQIVKKFLIRNPDKT